MSKVTNRPSEFLTVKQAAIYASCSEATIRRRIKNGMLKTEKLEKTNRALFVYREELDAMIENGKVSREECLRAIAHKVALQAPALSSECKDQLAHLLA